MNIRTRFAPSPTGRLHIGGLRTALYAYLFAKAENGTFILRIEDTDRKREVEGALENIINTLNHFGLTPDEGLTLQDGNVVEVGEHGPYTQSKRSDIYKKYAEQLLESGHAYRCFCTEERLTEMREKQQQLDKVVKYDKYCCNLAKEEIEKNIQEGKPFVVRLNVKPGNIVSFKDVVRKKIQFNTSDIDDQVLLKSDGHATYHLANVVDDHLMEITHVIRGEEWLSSTPKHILLYEGFGWEKPKFAHLPLVLNKDKSKLSKRQGDVAAEDYIAKGYTNDGLLNFIALLGWNPKNNEEVFTLKELEKIFKIENINKSGAVFDLQKLAWINKQHIKKLSEEEYMELATPYLEEYTDKNQEVVKKGALLEKERIEKFEDLKGSLDYLFQTEEYKPELLIWKKSDQQKTKENLQILHAELETYTDADFELNTLEEKIKNFITSNNLGMGDVLWPMRVALSGKDKSPSPFEIASTIGKEESTTRIKTAIEAL